MVKIPNYSNIYSSSYNFISSYYLKKLQLLDFPSKFTKKLLSMEQKLFQT